MQTLLTSAFIALQAAEGVPPVPLGVTLLFSLLLVALIATLALEETIHAKKSVIAGCFALVSLLAADAFGLLPVGHVVCGLWS